jgi:acetyl-CoA carboxylase carboxyltransferase component
MFGHGTRSTHWRNDASLITSSTSVSCPSAKPANYFRSGRVLDESALEALETRAEGFRKNVHLQSTAYYTSAHVLDDGVIDPRDTRDVLGMCLEIVSENGVRGNAAFGGVSRL